MLRFLSLTYLTFILCYQSSIASEAYEWEDDLTRSLAVSRYGSLTVEAGSGDHHLHETKYLKYTCGNVESPYAFQLYESCLITYFCLVLKEKKYHVDPELEKEVNVLNKFSLVSTTDYHRLLAFSTRMNNILPCRDTTFFGHIRRPFAYFWPTIDFYNAVLQIREHYPLGADYIDFLFKNDTNAIESLVKNATKNCDSSVNGFELLTLFAMHVFGHGKMHDLALAQEEVEKLLQSFSIRSAGLIYKIVDEYRMHLTEMASQRAAEFYLSGPEAEEINLDYEDD